MAEIHIPFTKQFKEPMLSGRKTVTSRTRRHGYAGDTFQAWGRTFEIIGVHKMLLITVRDLWYEDEGCKSPKEFEDTWMKLHRRRGFVPEEVVWLHEFKLLDREEKP